MRIRIRIRNTDPQSPEYGSNLDPDPQHWEKDRNFQQGESKKMQKKKLVYLAVCAIKLWEGLEPGCDGGDGLVHQADDHLPVLVLRLKNTINLNTYLQRYPTAEVVNRNKEYGVKESPSPP